ncbi:TRAP transporter substrate-binding protein [Bacterioplanoides pacificum]|uniref:TRAP transporter substrate-binding protein DctP n=1 Tax=Bacterioplanoides pacificum TaxID=1171596 RepID=A0ABV7VYH4_9GAMM
MKQLTSLLLALVLISPLASAATLKIATLAPDGTNWMKLMRQAARDIKKDTDGRVKIKYFPGGVQGSDKSVLRKMRIRQLQGGAISTGAMAQIANASLIYNLPFTFRNLDEVRAIRAEFDPIIKQALADKGFEVLGLSEGGFAYLMSDQALKTSDDVRSRKVWVPEGDQVSLSIFEAGNVEPISLPVSDVYTSLQTGLINTIAATPSAAIALQWHTKLQYATDFPLVFLFGMMVVDQRAFDKLSDADQQVVRQTMASAFKAMDSQNQKDERGARAALQQNGMQFVELSAEDKALWQQLADKALTELKAQNVYPADIYQRLQQRIEAFRNQQTATAE